MVLSAPSDDRPRERGQLMFEFNWRSHLENAVPLAGVAAAFRSPLHAQGLTRGGVKRRLALDLMVVSSGWNGGHQVARPTISGHWPDADEPPTQALPPSQPLEFD